MNTPDLSPISNVTAAASIADAFWRRVQQFPQAPVFTYAESSGDAVIWTDKSYRDVGRQVARLTRYLQSIGVRPGDRVAILSGTRPEWSIAELAILSLGAVSVSIYQSLPAHEVGYILYDSGASIAIAENHEQMQKLVKLLATPCPIPAREAFQGSDVKISLSHIISIEDVDLHPLCVSLSSILNNTELSDLPFDVPRGLSRDSLASLVYTSGTTGPAKGVMQSNGNRLANVYQATYSQIFPIGGRLFLYLPLAHSFARLIQDIGFLTPAGLAYPSVADKRTSRIDLTRVAREIREASATVVPSVPRLFEKMQAGLKSAASLNTPRGRLLRACFSNAKQVYESRNGGPKCGIAATLLYLLLAPVRRKIKLQLFGSNFSHAVAGGAKLDPGVNRFFDALGILICEGYGLTETCVATHVNLLNRRKIGSVGPAFVQMKVKIDPADNEIMMQGPNVTSGYWNRPVATADAWSPDGWFRTGDIGHIDEEGFLFITDRKKDLIITAGGKKVAPQAIEGMFKTCHLISYVVLCGEGKPFCSLLITLNEAEVRTHFGISASETTPLRDRPEVVAVISAEVDKVNASLASFEGIKMFRILPEDFTIENSLLTPTLKVKRKLVLERYAAVVSEIYSKTS